MTINLKMIQEQTINNKPALLYKLIGAFKCFTEIECDWFPSLANQILRLIFAYAFMTTGGAQSIYLLH